MIYALLILIMLLLAAAFVLNACMFKPPKAENKQIDGRRVNFRSGKNHLAGYLWNENGAHGLVILAHGMGTDIAYYLPEIHHFASAGYRVFAFEYTGYGDSTGHFYGFPQAVSDLKNAIMFINDGTLPLILVGHSMGGYAVCTVGQCLPYPVSALVAYAPFYSSCEAIRETTNVMPRCGALLCCVIQLVQRFWFGTHHAWNAADGLHAMHAPTLIIQGKDDREVSCTGCSLYAHRAEWGGDAVDFCLIDQADSSGHMTVIRKKGSASVNKDTMQQVDAFLERITKENFGR